MELSAEFKIRRYWLKFLTPADVLATLNWRWGVQGHSVRQPYVDINYWGDTDPAITLMELRYSEWIDTREMIVYTVRGDDGL